MLYYYPNRPTLIPPDKTFIDNLEKTGSYRAERKYNGDNVLVNTSTLEFWNRTKERHRYIPNDQMKEELSLWPKQTILNAELMNYRTKTTKNAIIVHCIMVWKGKPLIGKTWGDSRDLLDQCPSGKSVQISQLYQSGFWDLFQTADGIEIEGIILKQLLGKLIYSTTPIDDVSYMFKVRKPCKKYQF